MAEARSSLHEASCSLLAIPHWVSLDTPGIKSSCSLTTSISKLSNDDMALQYRHRKMTAMVVKYDSLENTLPPTEHGSKQVLCKLTDFTNP